MSGPVLCYDFTLSAEGNDVEELKVILEDLCREWVFQLERGEQTGYEHYQGRLKLKVKKRLQALKGALGYDNIHLSPTCSVNTKNNFYVTKEETRIAGPWSSNEDEEVRTMPRDLRDIVDLYPWQRSLKLIAETYEPRRVNIVVDTKGCTGKTLFSRYMMWHGLAQEIPFVNDFKELMQAVMGMPKLSCFIIDMPRAISKERLYQLYAGIETVKGGFAYDFRYKYRQEMFDPPVIIVFTNTMPDLSLLSEDRWKIWNISADKQLVENSDKNFEQEEEPSWAKSNMNQVVQSFLDGIDFIDDLEDEIRIDSV